MKKIFLFLSVILISVIIFSCNSECKKHEDIIGKWQRADVDTISYVLEITENHEWKYYKNEELLEEGPFAVEENIFIMKHAAEEHDHEGDDHDHAHAEDHKYEFSLNEDKTELSFSNEGKTTVFKKIK